MTRRIIEADLTWTAAGFERGVQVEIDAAGRIGQVGALQRPADMRLEGRALLPGLVNVHSHAFQRGLRGAGECFPSGRGSFWSWRQAMYQLVERLDGPAFKEITTQAFREMRACGITAVGEFHYLHHSPARRDFAFDRLVVEAAQEAGIRLVLLSACYSAGGIGQPLEQAQQRFATPDLEEFWDQLGQLERGQSNGVTLGVVAHSVRAVPLKDIVELHRGALERGYPFHIHVEEQRREAADCLSLLGRRPMQLLLDELSELANVTAIHCTHTDPSDLEGFLDRGGTIGLCPLTEANLGDGLCDLQLARAKDWPVALGTDSNARISMQEEMRWMEYGQRLKHEARGVLASKDGDLAPVLLASATTRGAASLGLEAGAIAPGKLADFCLLDLGHPTLHGVSQDNLLNSFILGASDSAVAGSCVGGEWLFSGG